MNKPIKINDALTTYSILAEKENNIIYTHHTSDPFRSDAESDYEYNERIKKEAAHRTIREMYDLKLQV